MLSETIGKPSLGDCWEEELMLVQLGHGVPGLWGWSTAGTEVPWGHTSGSAALGVHCSAEPARGAAE